MRRVLVTAAAALLLLGGGCERKPRTEDPRTGGGKARALTKEAVRREYLERGWSGLDIETRRWVNRLYRSDLARAHELLRGMAVRMPRGSSQYQEASRLAQMLGAGVSRLAEEDLERDTVQEFQPLIDRSLVLLGPVLGGGRSINF